MATNYPNNLDELINPNGTDQLSAPSHSEQHANANDAIEALQIKVGIDGSQDPDSLTYKINDIVSILGDLDNSTDNVIELLGLEGNNDLAVYGIENATNVDSFAKNTWKTVRYNLQVTRGADVYASEITATQSGSDMLVSESNIISNTNNSLFTYTFEENSGIISLRVTPVSGEIAVRFVRTALKA
jgi:hypothetical protein